MKTKKFLSIISLMLLLAPIISKAQCGDVTYKLDNSTHCDYTITINYVDCWSTNQHYNDVAYAYQTNVYTIPNCDHVTDVWAIDAGTQNINANVYPVAGHYVDDVGDCQSTGIDYLTWDDGVTSEITD